MSCSTESKGFHNLVRRTPVLRQLLMRRCPGQNLHWVWQVVCQCCAGENGQTLWYRVGWNHWIHHSHPAAWRGATFDGQI